MKNVAIKNTSPSLGRLLRSRERLIHAATRIVPAEEVVKEDGTVVMLPAVAVSLRAPYRNPHRINGKRVR